jgi:hypothetical protein
VTDLGNGSRATLWWPGFKLVAKPVSGRAELGQNLQAIKLKFLRNWNPTANQQTLNFACLSTPIIRFCGLSGIAQRACKCAYKYTYKCAYELCTGVDKPGDQLTFMSFTHELSLTKKG